MENLQTHVAVQGVFFLFLGDVEEINKNKRMYYQSRCLIRGLQELGIKLSANINAFGVEKAAAPVNALWVVDVSEIPFALLGQKETIDQLQKLPAKNKIFLYGGDNGSKFYFPCDMPLMIVSENRFLELPGQRIPWAYGLSPELLNFTKQPYQEREEVFLANFRPSFNQSLRQALDLSFVGNLEAHFRVDRELTDAPLHFEKLGRYLGCLAYGGAFEQDLTLNPAFGSNIFYTHPDGAYVSPLDFKFHQNTIILRWDSWRIWEAFACGALVIQPDMEKYGFVWPEMPLAGEHYVEIDLSNPKACVDFLLQKRERLPAIAQAGQAWAAKYYSPQAVAKRFLNIGLDYSC